MEQIWSMIGQYAFPIVACVCVGWYVKYIEDKHREDLKEIHASHKVEMDEISLAVKNNTLAIQRLTDYIIKQNG